MNRFYLATILIVTVASSARAATQLTSCGFLQLDDDVVIPADLDCSAQPLTLRIDGRHTIAFQGATLTEAEITCDNCVVEGPGTLVGRIDGTTLSVTDLEVLNGVLAARFLRVERCQIRGPTMYGYSGDCAIEGEQAFTRSRLRVIDTIISGAHCGIRSEADTVVWNSLIEDSVGGGVFVYSSGYPAPLRMKNTQILRSGDHGLIAMRMIVTDSVIADSGDVGVRSDGGLDFFPPSASIKRSSVTGNRIGILAVEALRVSASTVTGNRERGVAAGGLRPQIRNSDLRGNGTAAECGSTIVCADISANNEPHVDGRTLCDTSYVSGSGNPGENWGVCALD